MIVATFILGLGIGYAVAWVRGTEARAQLRRLTDRDAKGRFVRREK